MLPVHERRLFDQPRLDQLPGERVDVSPASFSPDSQGNDKDEDAGPLNSVDDPVVLSDGPQTPQTRQFTEESLPLFLRIGDQLLHA